MILIFFGKGSADMKWLAKKYKRSNTQAAVKAASLHVYLREEFDKGSRILVQDANGHETEVVMNLP